MCELTKNVLKKYYHNLERAYKNHLSGYRIWEQLDHAADWMLLDKNIGGHLSMDETSFCDDLFAILSNKEGHGRQGCIIAAVRGTKMSEVNERTPPKHDYKAKDSSEGFK